MWKTSVNSRENDILGPNTAAPQSALRPACIVCAGEDRAEFLRAMGAAGAGEILLSHAHRGYEFWRFSRYCAILSGIGTGCLEPLLWEILAPPTVERVILVGTAGSMPKARVQIARPYFVSQAWPAGTGIDALACELPLRPRWALPQTVQVASTVSTDFYYGFSSRLLTDDYPADDGYLRALYAEHVNRGTELVDMEAAQFYFFCEQFGHGRVQYAAIKAPVNPAGFGENQLANSALAISRAVNLAITILDARP